MTAALTAFLAGYGCRDPLPEIAGRYAGKGLVICGDSACIWSDLEAFGCRDEAGKGRVSKAAYDFMVVNKIGETFPGDIEHWYSNAPHLLHRFAAARRQEYAKEFSLKHMHSCQEAGAIWHWPFGGHGTSGLGALLAGVGLGYFPVVLCGIPLDNGPHNGEPPWRRTKFASSEAAGPDGGPDQHWGRAMLAFKGAVFSMSGRTREWFGQP